MSRTQTLKEIRLVLENGFSIFIAPEAQHISSQPPLILGWHVYFSGRIGRSVMPVAIDYKIWMMHGLVMILWFAFFKMFQQMAD
jgi:hypothetical protein